MEEVVLLKYLETAFHEDDTLRVSQQTVLSSEIIRELREDHAEADKNLFKGWLTLLTLFFTMLYIIDKLLTNMHQL